MRYEWKKVEISWPGYEAWNPVGKLDIAVVQRVKPRRFNYEALKWENEERVTVGLYETLPEAQRAAEEALDAVE